MKQERVRTRIKINDTVVVQSGADRGRKGKVLLVDRKKNRIVVEGINKKNKRMRATQENPKGGIISREFPIPASKVMIFCDKCKGGVRLGSADSEKTGKRTRVCRGCGKSFD